MAYLSSSVCLNKTSLNCLCRDTWACSPPQRNPKPLSSSRGALPACAGGAGRGGVTGPAWGLCGALLALSFMTRGELQPQAPGSSCSLASGCRGREGGDPAERPAPCLGVFGSGQAVSRVVPRAFVQSVLRRSLAPRE